MKHAYHLLTGLLLLLGTHAAFAQKVRGLTANVEPAPAVDSLRQALDRMFAPLDKSLVPAPYLEEYGNRFASLTPYNGTLTDSSVTTLTTWRLLYASVVSGNVGRASALPLLPDLNVALATQVAAMPGTIPLVVQRLDYAKLRPDARTANLVSVSNGQFYDVPGRWTSPYLVRTLFAVAPTRTASTVGNPSFMFTPGLTVHDGGTGSNGITALSLDFGDGQGYRTATWSVPVYGAYCSPGMKRVKVRVSYGASSYESHFDLYVQQANCTQYLTGQGGTSSAVVASKSSKTPVSNLYSGGDVAELRQVFAPRAGVHSGGTVHVRFGGNRFAGTRSPGDRTIYRPLIVAEGYDGFSVAPAVYGSNYDVLDFLDDIDDTNLYNNLEGAPGGVAGYDIVFIDYNHGTDDIRRNAALFEEVVRWVNAQKAGGTATGQQNVVLGISMGGLVARYGLAEMVKNPQVPNNDPHTRLLITHDSPHRGANTPLGIQMLTRQAAGSLAGQTLRAYNSVGGVFTFGYLDSLFPELEQADRLLNAPATQQLLLVRAVRDGIYPYATFRASYNSFVESEYRAMITPAAGQVLPYRFIATSLGSQCGRELFQPYAELVRVQRRGYFGIPGLTTGYRAEVIVNALPQPGRVERLSVVRVWSETKVLGITLPRVYLTNYVFNSPSDNPVAWDGLPGGTQPVATDEIPITTGSSSNAGSALIFKWGSSANSFVANEFCFVPRASALDVATLDFPSLKGAYINDATSGSASRAERVIAQAEFSGDFGQQFNERHPFFPARQAQWIFNEMQRPFNGNAANVAGCTTECPTPLSIASSIGYQQICRGTSVTFSIPGLPAGTVVNWSATPTSDFTVASGSGATFTTSPSSTATGTSTITARVGPCQTPISLSVAAGPGEPSGTYNFNGGTYPLLTTNRLPSGGGQVTLRLNQPNRFTFTPNPTSTVLSSASNYTTFNVPPSSSNGVGIKAVSTDSGTGCGLEGNYVFYLAGPYGYSIAPNPADTDLTVEATSRGGAPDPDAPLFEAELYDNFGQKVKTKKSSRGKAVLDVRALPAGLYHLRIGQGKDAISEHIQIIH